MSAILCSKEAVDTNPQLQQEVEKVQARSRVSQAWLALRAARLQAADLKKKGELHDDLDAMLPKEEMDDLEDRFWARYKLQFSAENTPADMLVSRLAKEISKRLFQVKSHSNRTGAVGSMAHAYLLSAGNPATLMRVPMRLVKFLQEQAYQKRWNSKPNYLHGCP